MIDKEIICKKCGEPFITHHNNEKHCASCKIIHKKEYHHAYNAKYNASRRYDETITKREYNRTTLKNKASKDQIDSYMKYCRENYNKVQGCLNCICAECIQSANDDFLIWEQEDGFYEKEYKRG